MIPGTLIAKTILLWHNEEIAKNNQVVHVYPPKP